MSGALFRKKFAKCSRLHINPRKKKLIQHYTYSLKNYQLTYLKASIKTIFLDMERSDGVKITSFIIIKDLISII
jgi:hypothetical protein